ncbi:MAG TPA: glycosyltransferase [Bryobacteraceae bacterium]|jgi:spore maturation protein CgeB|nr:glycosyltransferase [Bryobacteraceae bacterium]
MKLVFFGLSVSSAWGNGHATLLRGLFRALRSQGHRIHFFEKDVPYYAAQRDAATLPYAQIHLYRDWTENLEIANRELAGADVGFVTSYCPDGIAACELVLNSNLPRTVFYDMDTPVTLERLQAGERVPYLPENGLGDFDQVLSYTGGAALEQLKSSLGAQCVAPLYGWVDPDVHHRVPSCDEFTADLSYLGTYALDRQQQLEELLLCPARRLMDRRFVIAGAMYPEIRSWPTNVRHLEHVAPAQHAAFYSSAPLTLNITRGAMAAMGYCPSGRLFEAAACGTVVLSDWWNGLDSFFEPGQEILIAEDAEQAAAAIQQHPETLRRMGERARERALDCHTAAVRAQHLINLLESPRDENSVADIAYAGKRV